MTGQISVGVIFLSESAKVIISFVHGTLPEPLSSRLTSRLGARAELSTPISEGDHATSLAFLTALGLFEATSSHPF